MFGHQNSDDGTQNTTNPALPGSFPAIPDAAESNTEAFNPALPTTTSNVSYVDSQAAPAPSAPTPPATDDTTTDAPSDVITVAGSDELLDIKQQALSQLSPLVSHLDQTPEEKFRTTMMMIQATDNQDLVKDAYAAAQEITDEKAKAQALLDIVNEINYFTQQHNA